MTPENPTDAVREAPTELDRIIADMRHEAAHSEPKDADALNAWADRLAALAGAAPDSPVTIEDLHAASIDLTGGRPSEEVIRELRGHAPAKAREDDRANYWKQRAKSAEGHLWASDTEAAAMAVHSATNFAEKSWEELTDTQRAACRRAAVYAIRAVNSERELRRPKNALATFAEGRE